MVACHEVPPHEQVLGHGLPAEQQQRGAVLAGHIHAGGPPAEVAQRAEGYGLPGDAGRPVGNQHAVLEVALQRQRGGGAGREPHLGTHERGMPGGRGSEAGGLADHRGDGQPVGLRSRELREVLERRGPITVLGGERDPQLDAEQPRGTRRGVLRVRDPAPGRHQAEFPGPDELVVAQAVAVLDLAGQEPGDGLQPDVRMGWHDHPPGARRRDVHRTVVVDEAPGPDRADAAVRERAANQDPPRPAQRHLAGQQRRHGRRGLGHSHSPALVLARIRIQIAHTGETTSAAPGAPVTATGEGAPPAAPWPAASRPARRRGRRRAPARRSPLPGGSGRGSRRRPIPP